MPRAAAAVLPFTALAACASAPPPAPSRAASPTPERTAAFYELRFAGHPIGTIELVQQRRGARTELVRRERILLLRGGERVHQELELRILGEPLGRASLVELRQHDCSTGSPSATSPPPSAPDSASVSGSGSGSGSGSVSESASVSASASDSVSESASVSVSDSVSESASAPWPPPCIPSPRTTLSRAERHPDGWHLETPAGHARLPAAAEPAEWLERWQRAPAAERPLPSPTHHLVFLPARSFALGSAAVRWISPSTWVGTLTLGGATLEATTELGRDGVPRVTLDDTGLTAVRVPAPPPPRPLADLIALSSLPVRGQPSSRLRLTLQRAATPPPELPGQRIRAHGARWDIELEPQTWAADAEPLAALAAAIADDDPQARRGQRVSDCTAYALRFAAAARARGLRVRLVTGLALDGATLVRHRWALVHTGARWLTVDPAAGQAPATARLLALTVHEATAAALAGADAAFSALRDARAHFAP